MQALIDLFWHPFYPPGYCYFVSDCSRLVAHWMVTSSDPEALLLSLASHLQAQAGSN